MTRLSGISPSEIDQPQPNDQRAILFFSKPVPASAALKRVPAESSGTGTNARSSTTIAEFPVDWPTQIDLMFAADVEKPTSTAT